MKVIRKASGFSLVEITLALGIISFALVSLLGLGSLVLGKAGSARDDTLQVNIIQSVITEMRKTPWSQLAEREFYFDADGQASTAADALFLCQVQRRTATPPDWPVQATSMACFQVKLSWPLNAASRKSFVLPISISHYE